MQEAKEFYALVVPITPEYLLFYEMLHYSELQVGFVLLL